MGFVVRFCTLLWSDNSTSYSWSRYDESWVDRLARGVRRHAPSDVEFVVYSDRVREYSEIVTQIVIPRLGLGGYGDCVRPYADGGPMILVGLDTVVVGDLAPLVDYCVSASVLALPRDVYRPSVACNGVALVPGGVKFKSVRNVVDDMYWCRSQPHVFIDDVLPGTCASYKGDVRDRPDGRPADGTSLVYFHGVPKPCDLLHLDWIEENWR